MSNYIVGGKYYVANEDGITYGSFNTKDAALETAKEQASRSGYPMFVLFVCTRVVKTEHPVTVTNFVPQSATIAEK